MTKKEPRDLAVYIKPLSMNGLSGRMLRVPASSPSKKREILLVYGHHSSLERMFGYVEVLSRYGNVTMPDLPGFGGMDPLYKIGEKPTLENMADYLASFIKLRYRQKTVTIIAMSFGFAVLTKMLQKYPELSGKVDLLVSFVGLTNKNDIGMKRRNFLFFKYFSKLMSIRPLAAFTQHIMLRGPIIRLSYKLVEDQHSKLQDADVEERRRRVDFEIFLWQCNDFRTYAYTGSLMFTLNLQTTKVDLDVLHIGVKKDRYLNRDTLETNMRQIYNDFEYVESKMPAHAPTVIATAKEAEPFVPSRLKQLLRKKV